MRIGRLLTGEDAARVAHHEADSADVHPPSLSDGPEAVSMSSVSRSARYGRPTWMTPYGRASAIWPPVTTSGAPYALLFGDATT
jgi:hypothetical protein